jgi:hypothetical protein
MRHQRSAARIMVASTSLSSPMSRRMTVVRRRPLIQQRSARLVVRTQTVDTGTRRMAGSVFGSSVKLAMAPDTSRPSVLMNRSVAARAAPGVGASRA